MLILKAQASLHCPERHSTGKAGVLKELNALIKLTIGCSSALSRILSGKICITLAMSSISKFTHGRWDESWLWVLGLDRPSNKRLPILQCTCTKATHSYSLNIIPKPSSMLLLKCKNLHSDLHTIDVDPMTWTSRLPAVVLLFSHAFYPSQSPPLKSCQDSDDCAIPSKFNNFPLTPSCSKSHSLVAKHPRPKPTQMQRFYRCVLFCDRLLQWWFDTIPIYRLPQVMTEKPWKHLGHFCGSQTWSSFIQSFK